MHARHPLSLTALAALGALLAAPAHAQDSYYYLGFGLGQAQARIDDGRIAQGLAGSGVTVNNISHDERDQAYKLFGGYQINRNWGVELGYFHIGDFSFGTTTTPPGTLNGKFGVEGVNAGVVGTLPFTDRFSGLARIGVQYARTHATLSTSGAVTVANTSPSDKDTNVKIGLGLQYAFSPSFMARAEVERFRFSNAVGDHPQVAMYSVSLVFPFGRTEAPVRRAMTTPDYVAAPEPVARAAPEVVVQPMAPSTPVAAFAPPQVRRVSYSAESFFAFDRAELQPAGKRALDTFAGELQGVTFDTIAVQGYADRIGTTTYNQTLSVARAEAVKAYLVETGRLDGTKITTTGKGELEPVTVPDACRGAVTPALIACLQPDRRVEIEVTGTR
jgi:OOP family OmpA-OmpF porin